jgi:hypothetical protein
MLRCLSISRAAQQQLSSAVKQLLQALFATAAQQPLEQHSSWIKSSCNLLLRALTRSPQFISDPMLPMLPGDAMGLLSWLNATAMGTSAAATAAGHHSAGSAGSGAVSNGSLLYSSMPDGDGDAAHSNSPCATGDEQVLAQQRQQYGAGKLLLRDDKVYLLLTKLIITATGLSPEAAAAAAAANYATDAGGAMASTAAANGAAARSVSFSKPPAVPPAGGFTAHGGGNSSGSNSSASISDPGLLIELLEWSGTKVKLAMQQLLEAGGEYHCSCFCAVLHHPGLQQPHVASWRLR